MTLVVRLVPSGAAMGTIMLLPTVLCFLLGYATASMPLEDFRSNLEYLNTESAEELARYRLRDVVQPTDVNVTLDVDIAGATFTGVVDMVVVVTEDNLQQFVFHQNVVSIDRVSVLNSANQHVNLLPNAQMTLDSYLELIQINFAAPIPRGTYSINIQYTGSINTNPVDRGFYRGYYYYNNQLRQYATTQFQPFHARKAFPCFDEPQFKSRYTITIIRDVNLRESYSNMAISSSTASGNRVTETFEPTPIISAYLVAFHVSDFVSTEITSTPSKPFKIIAREGVNYQHQYAAEIGLEITNQLDDYFGIQYHEMGQGNLMKNDHIALPDFPSGAMENWGMVNYREAYLLYDPANTNLQNKIFIATIMAHELGHKWFGNLVTCFWWSNLWLNESFASFFEYFGAHWADPSLELDDQFVVDYVHSALNHDAGSGAQPMNWTGVASNPSISAHFSVTSYAKGASVLKMLEHFVGFRTFRNALRYYLRNNAYGIGTPTDMYAAFRQAVDEDWEYRRDFGNVNIEALFDSWVQNPGSPVLNVTRNAQTGAMVVTQSRYQISGTPAVQQWQIPLTWTQNGQLNFNSTRPSQILTGLSTIIASSPGENFVIFNIAQSGLYRVFYDTNNWALISTYLKSNNRVNIHKLNRAQIVNDVLYFVRSHHINKTLAFDVLDFLRSETDYYVWNGALTQLDWILRRLENIPRAHAAFVDYLLALMRNVINDLGYDERPTDSTSTILNRAQILNVACNLGHAGCIADSLQKWRAHMQNTSVAISPNLRRHVYCVGLREGNATDYEFLFQRYIASENTADMVVMLRALGCATGQASIQHYLTQSMENDRIRIHDRTNAFSFALQGNHSNVPVVLNFFRLNYQRISTTYGGEARLNLCINAFAAHLNNFAIIQEFQTWVYSAQAQLPVSSFNAGVAVVDAAMANLNWGNDAALEIFNFVITRGASSTILASSVLLIAAMLLQLFR